MIFTEREKVHIHSFPPIRAPEVSRKQLSIRPLLLACSAAILLMAGMAVANVNYNLLREIALDRYGKQAVEVVDQWQAEIKKMKPLPDEEKLRLTNAFFNSRVKWVSDKRIFQQEDYWATPLEVMGEGQGDCEDFAIAKYITLVLSGVEIDKLRITYVKAKIRRNGAVASQAHMVLAYYSSPTEEPVVLDNIIPEIYSASRRTDLTPVYGFNSKGIWVGTATKPASNQPEARLSRWRDLLRRAAEEGVG
jgi:predicted transglutaminase-like cysteine proteinase